jgi:hypothetical protein
MDTSLLGDLQKRVEKRNKYAHAHGQLLLTSEDVFWNEIKEYNIPRVCCLLLLRWQLFSKSRKRLRNIRYLIF